MLMTAENAGIVIGFAGALLNAANYGMSKDCVERYQLHGLRQVIASHIAMMLIALPLLLLTGHYRALCPELLWICVVMIAPYIFGQYLLIRLLDYTDSSVVSPLLTLKIPVIALTSYLVLDQGYSTPQILAILALIVLAFVFSSCSGTVRLWQLGVMLLVCGGYVGSDYGALYFLAYYPGDSLSRSLACVCWEYSVCGLLALPLFFTRRLRLTAAHLYQCKWVALTWLGAVLCWVLCFYLADVVTGNIIQAMRCLLGLLAAYIFFRSYIADRGTFKKKLTVSLLMFAAVVVYNV